MITREQVDAAIEDISTIVKVSQTHRDSFDVIVEYVRQEPESEDEMGVTLNKLLLVWDDHTNMSGWAITAGPNLFGLVQSPNGSGDYKEVVSPIYTLEEILDELRELTELTEPPVPTLEDIRAFISLGGDSACWTHEEVDKIRRYIAAQRTLTEKT